MTPQTATPRTQYVSAANEQVSRRSKKLSLQRAGRPREWIFAIVVKQEAEAPEQRVLDESG